MLLDSSIKMYVLLEYFLMAAISVYVLLECLHVLLGVCTIRVFLDY